MKIIFGLGNPGGEYKDTRHNIGFMVVDKLGHELGKDTAVFKEEEKFKSALARVGDVLLVKPVIFMNNSGIAVSSILNFYKLQPSDIIVIHDDMDLPLGKIKIRESGSSAGHHGVQSIMDKLHTDKFLRVRLGIGKGKENTGLNTDRRLNQQTVIHFVLSHFSRHEAGALKHLIKNGTEAVRVILTEGVDKAMNRYN